MPMSARSLHRQNSWFAQAFMKDFQTPLSKPGPEAYLSYL